MNVFLSALSGFLSFVMLISPFSPISRFSKSNSEENTMNIRVATYNIRNGADVDHDFSVIAKDILDNDIDIVGIQEVDNRTNRNGKQKTMEILSELTGYEYYNFVRCIDFDGGAYGTGILSKYPIEDFEAIYLTSDGHEQRKVGHAVINVEGTFIDFFNTHLSWESKDTRLKQFDEIAELTAASESGYFIVTGDFNTSDFTEYEVIKNAKLVNNADTRMISCSDDGAIDNIVYSKNFRKVSYGMYDKVNHSDHKMIWAELSFTIPEKTEATE